MYTTADGAGAVATAEGIATDSNSIQAPALSTAYIRLNYDREPGAEPT